MIVIARDGKEDDDQAWCLSMRPFVRVFAIIITSVLSAEITFDGGIEPTQNLEVLHENVDSQRVRQYPERKTARPSKRNGSNEDIPGPGHMMLVHNQIDFGRRLLNSYLWGVIALDKVGQHNHDSIPNAKLNLIHTGPDLDDMAGYYLGALGTEVVCLVLDMQAQERAPCSG